MPDTAHDALTSPLSMPAASVLPIRGEGLTVLRGGRRILERIDIEFSTAGISVLMGPNGAGKSVLLRVLAALIAPQAGAVSWGGSPPHRQRRKGLGFVFQKPVLLRRSTLANVRYALRAAGAGRRESVERSNEVLRLAGLDHLARSPARLLSGGEQQRLAIARALATRPEVLFLDEPTANLDPASTAGIETLIREAADAGRKVVLVTHDPGQARRLADEVTFMHAGQITEQGSADAFFEAPSTHAARAFLAGDIVV